VPKSRRRLFENYLAFLAPVGFLKMTRVLFEKADWLLAMSRENKITGVTSSRHSSSVSGSFQGVAVNDQKDVRTCNFGGKFFSINDFFPGKTVKNENR
jgi:hypothetical protein